MQSVPCKLLLCTMVLSFTPPVYPFTTAITNHIYGRISSACPCDGHYCNIHLCTVKKIEKKKKNINFLPTVLRTESFVMLTKEENDHDFEGMNMNSIQTAQSFGKEINNTDDEQQPVFESLDVVLNNARKRPMIMFIPYHIQAIFNKPIVKVSLPKVNYPSAITIGDMVLVLIALKLNSVGFAFGYIFGKLSTQFLRENNGIFPVAVVELWTVLLAVGLDVVWNNFID